MLARQSQTEGISVRLCDAGLRIRQANLCSVAVRARALLGFFAVIELFPAMTFGNRHVRFLFCRRTFARTMPRLRLATTERVG